MTKKLIVFCYILFLGFTFVGCASFVNWGKRINLTTGAVFTLNDNTISVEGFENAAGSISISDGFGDRYTTSWEVKKEDPLNIPIAFDLSIPLYWKDFRNDINIETGILGKLYLPHIGAGFYLEGTKNRLSVKLAAGGCRPGDYYTIETTPASYAWYGDPGIYSDGNFHNPSTLEAEVTVDQQLNYGLFASASLKWHFIKWLYLEGGYSYYGETGIDITGISAKTDYTEKKTYDYNGSISLTDRHIIYLGIGIGY
jgi:hypothetical protein